MKLTPEEEAMIRKMRNDKVDTSTVKLAKDWADVEKVQAFDKLHKMAMETYNHAKLYGCGGHDADHYIYEEVMKLCLGKDVFATYNQFVL